MAVYFFIYFDMIIYMKKYIRAFIAGSAFPVVVWPFIYIGIPSIYNPGSELVFESIALTLPIVIGILNILFIAIRNRLPFGSRGNYWFFGTLHGLSFSLYGNFISSIPQDLYLLNGIIQYVTIPAAILAYGLIWRYIIRNLNIMLEIER